MFRKKSIFISNASCNHLMVSVSADICYAGQQSYGVNGDVAGVARAGFQYQKGGKWEKADKKGYSMISRQSSAKFAVESNKKTAYITTRYKKKIQNKPKRKTSKIKDICINHPITIGKGIITNKCHIRNAKKKWVDTDGKDHTPAEEPNDSTSKESSDESENESVNDEESEKESDEDDLENESIDSEESEDDSNHDTEDESNEVDDNSESGSCYDLTDDQKSESGYELQDDQESDH